MRVTMVNKYYFPHLGGIEYHVHDLGERAGGAARHRACVPIVANEGRDTVVGDRRRRRGHAAGPRVRVRVDAGRVRDDARAARRGDAARSPPTSSTCTSRTRGARRRGCARGRRLPTRAHVPQRHRAAEARCSRSTARCCERVLDRVDLIIASRRTWSSTRRSSRRCADKCRVVPFGIHVERYADTPEVARARRASCAPATPRPIVLFVGRLIYYKGADVLVRAMADVDADLVVIGRGPLEPRAARARGGARHRRSRDVPAAAARRRARRLVPRRRRLLPAERRALRGVRPRAARGARVRHAGRLDTACTTGVPFVNQDGVTGSDRPARRRRRARRGAADASWPTTALRARLGEQARRARAGATSRSSAWSRDTLAVYDEARSARKLTHVSRGRFIALSLVLDAVLVNVGIVAAFFIRVSRGAAARVQLRAVRRAWRRSSRSLYLGAGYIYGLYEPERTESVWAVVRAVVAGGRRSASLLTLRPPCSSPGPGFFAFPRLVIVIAWPLQFALLRRLARSSRCASRRSRWPEQRVLIVGTGDARDRARRRARAARRSGATASSGSWRATRASARCRAEGRGLSPCSARSTTLAGVVARRRGRPRHRRVAGRAARARRGPRAHRRERRARRRRSPSSTRSSSARSTRSWPTSRSWRSPARTVPAWFGGTKRSSTSSFAAVLLVVLSPVPAARGRSRILLTMGLPGLLPPGAHRARTCKPFGVLKFRTMVRDAEARLGPGARRPRTIRASRRSAGSCARTASTSCRSS